jgi:hypothetical protein
MAIVINGSGTVTGISVGGLPDDIVDAGMMADNSIDSDAYVDASIDNAHLADDAVGVAELSATGTASSSTFLRGDNAWASAGGDNTPNFLAISNVTDLKADNVDAKVNFDNESYDSDGAFASSRFTVPSGEGGKYFIYSQAQASQQADSMYFTKYMIYKNGSVIRTETTNNGSIRTDGKTLKITSIEDLAATDYIEIYANLNSDPGANGYLYATNTYFTMFKLL